MSNHYRASQHKDNQIALLKMESQKKVKFALSEMEGKTLLILMFS
jgi:hypothetical protein